MRSPLRRLVTRMWGSTGANSARQRPHALPFVCLLIHLCSYWVSHQAMNGLGKGCPNGHATRLRSVIAIDEHEQHLRAMCTNHSTSESQCRSSVERNEQITRYRARDSPIPLCRPSNARAMPTIRKAHARNLKLCSRESMPHIFSRAPSSRFQRSLNV